jgi:mannose-6-phosphate isomerase-like protein (cupin superfamily)
VTRWIAPALIQASEPLARAAYDALPVLRWRQNPNYRDPTFLVGYAYCELLGPDGHARRDDVSAGLLCLAPSIHYPPHAHPAEEAYHVLHGTSEWQRGDEPWVERSAGARIEHPSGVTHAMRALSSPLLALYLWRGAIAEPARLVEPQ